MSKRQHTYQHIGVPGYGTDEHKSNLFQLFHADDAKVKQNKEFIDALNAIRPLIERNLIQLTADHLPFGAAFRVPEHSYLGISMSKDSLHGQAINMSIVDDLFQISQCGSSGEDLSCFLTYLYPQWYASEKNASFAYISSQLNKTHYKIIPLESFTKSTLRFLKLTLPVYELKSVSGFLPGFQGTWDSLMATPREIVHQLTQVSSHDELSRLIQTVIGQGVPLDGNFFRTFAGTCDQLNITFTQYELFIQEMFQLQDIKMNQLMIESRFITTYWYKNVVTKLMTAGISVTNDPANKVYAFILAVALVDVITPLYMQHIVSKFVHTIILTADEHGLSDENVKDLKDLSRRNPSSDQITDKVHELSSRLALNDADKQTLVKNLFNLSFSYNVISEVERNKMNFGIMNIELTNALIDFFKTWYLKDIIISDIPTRMLDALITGYEAEPNSTVEEPYDDGRMRMMYGTSFRNSEQYVDFDFALCLNILLFQLFPNKVAGYYLGQSIRLRSVRHNIKNIGTMNAELTMTQLYNQLDMKYNVRSVKRVGNEFETQSESDGGGRRRRKRTRRKRQKKHIKSKSKSKTVSKRKKKVQYRTNRHN
jgi:hypothetical protein